MGSTYMSLLLSSVNQIMTLLQSQIGISGLLLALVPVVVPVVGDVLLVHLLLSVLRHGVVLAMFVALVLMVLLTFVMMLKEKR